MGSVILQEVKKLILGSALKTLVLLAVAAVDVRMICVRCSELACPGSKV